MTTRRGLFGLFGGALAAPVVPIPVSKTPAQTMYEYWNANIVEVIPLSPKPPILTINTRLITRFTLETLKYNMELARKVNARFEQ